MVDIDKLSERLEEIGLDVQLEITDEIIRFHFPAVPDEKEAEILAMVQNLIMEIENETP